MVWPRCTDGPLTHLPAVMAQCGPSQCPTCFHPPRYTRTHEPHDGVGTDSAYAAPPPAPMQVMLFSGVPQNALYNDDPKAFQVGYP